LRYRPEDGAAVLSQATTVTVVGGATAAYHTVPVTKGWNLVSTHISPEKRSVDELFEKTSITHVRSTGGQTVKLASKQSAGMEWADGRAFMLFSSREDSLTFVGTDISRQDIMMSLDAGWNYISFPGRHVRPIGEVFGEQTAIVMILDGDGRIYSPSQGVASLRYLEPGRGYRVFTRAATRLLYSGSTTGGLYHSPDVEPTGATSDSVQGRRLEEAGRMTDPVQARAEAEK